MELSEYQQLFTPETPVGWAFIEARIQEFYPDLAPRHYAPTLHYVAGGSDPLDGVSIYTIADPEPHYLLVSYGLSELYYNEDAAGGEFSKWGFELTFRVKPFPDDNGDPHWAINLMQNLARYVFDTGRWFEEGHFIRVQGGLRQDSTALTALGFMRDAVLGSMQTPHGEVSFVQMVGLTETEYETLERALRESGQTAEESALMRELLQQNPLLITDLHRK